MSRLGTRATWAIALCIGATACGSSQSAAPAARAGPASSAQPSAAAAPAAKPAPDSSAGQALQRFTVLAKELDERKNKGPVDRAWLESELKNVLKADDTYLPAKFAMAALAEQNGDVKSAKLVYLALNKSNPDFAPAAENLAAILVDEGQRSEAKAIYAAIVKKDPKDVTSRLGLGRIDVAEKKYQEAIDLARQVLQQQADSIEAFRVLAESYVAIGNTSMAELIIGRALKVDQNDADLQYLLAQLVLGRGDVAGGVQKLKQVITIRPKWLKPRAQLADIALSYRDFGGAAQEYEAILKEAPKDRGCKIGLAVSYKGLGRFELVEKIYTEILKEDPKDVRALWNLAVLYHRNLTRYDDAIAMYKRAKAAAAPTDTYAQGADEQIAIAQHTRDDIAQKKAREEHERKKHDAIIAACQAVVDHKPANGDAIGSEQERDEVAWQLWNEGQAAVQAGDPAGENAIHCAFAIIPSTPRGNTDACAPMHLLWTQMLYQLNRLEEALAADRDALKCDPQNPDAQLIEKQLQQLIAEAKAAAAPPGAAPAEGNPAAQPAPAAPENPTPAENPTPKRKGKKKAQ